MESTFLHILTTIMYKTYIDMYGITTFMNISHISTEPYIRPVQYRTSGRRFTASTESEKTRPGPEFHSASIGAILSF